MQFDTPGGVVPLKPEAFLRSLQLGLGRAVIHLRTFGDEGLREQLLRACTRNMIWEATCDSPRAGWLFSLLELSQHMSWYGGRILDALAKTTSGWNAVQLFGLARRLATRGYERARAVMYRKLDTFHSRYDPECARELVWMDGERGLLHVARVLGRRLLAGETHTDRSDLPLCPPCTAILEAFGSAVPVCDESTLAMVSRPHERRGFDPALMVLDRQAGRGNSVRRYLEHVREAVAAESRLDSTTADRAVSFAEFTAVLDQPLASCHAILAGFAHSASTADISRAFSMLLAERSPLRIEKCLYLFRTRPPPCSTRGCWN